MYAKSNTLIAYMFIVQGDAAVVAIVFNGV